METNNSNKPINDDAKFENEDIDPGFLGHQGDENELEGQEDERDHNIDADLSIKEMREGKEEHDSEDTDR